MIDRMRVDINNGDPRDALAYAALAAESYFVGLIKAGDRRVAICSWEGRRVAVLVQQALYDNNPELAGALIYVQLMTPELVDAPVDLLHLFADPALAGCIPMIHEDETVDNHPTE